MKNFTFNAIFNVRKIVKNFISASALLFIYAEPSISGAEALVINPELSLRGEKFLEAYQAEVESLAKSVVVINETAFSRDAKGLTTYIYNTIYYIDIHGKKYRIESYQKKAPEDTTEILSQVEIGVNGSVYALPYIDANHPGDLIVTKPQSGQSIADIPVVFEVLEQPFVIHQFSSKDSSGLMAHLSTLLEYSVKKYFKENLINTIESHSDSPLFPKGSIGLWLKDSTIQEGFEAISLIPSPFPNSHLGPMIISRSTRKETTFDYSEYKVHSDDEILNLVLAKNYNDFGFQRTTTSISTITKVEANKKSFFDPLKLDAHKIYDAESGAEIKR